MSDVNEEMASRAGALMAHLVDRGLVIEKIVIRVSLGKEGENAADASITRFDCELMSWMDLAAYAMKVEGVLREAHVEEVEDE